MDVLEWVVVIGWSLVGFLFLVQGLRFLGDAAGGDPGAGRAWISPGHALLLAACRTLAGMALVGLAAAVALGAPPLWAVVGGPAVLVASGAVAFGGTRAIARKHGMSL